MTHENLPAEAATPDTDRGLTDSYVVMRNAEGLVYGYDDLVGRAWFDLSTGDPVRVARATRTMAEIGYGTDGYGIEPRYAGSGD
jgi:hypothetical protein